MVSQHALQVSRPTPRGEVEGSGLGGSPGPHPGGFSRPTPGGVLQVHTGGSPGRPPHYGYCCGWCASYLNAFLFSWRNGSNVMLAVKESRAAPRSINEDFIKCGQQSILIRDSLCLRNPGDMSPEVTTMGVSGPTKSPDVRGCKQQRM